MQKLLEGFSHSTKKGKPCQSLIAVRTRSNQEYIKKVLIVLLLSAAFNEEDLLL